MKRALQWIVILAAISSATGCVAVQPWERGKLSSAVMNPNPDLLELKTDGHVHEYREGSIGGSGVSGGGCGCN